MTMRWLLFVTVVFGLQLQTLPSACADWPTYQQNTQRTGVTSEALIGETSVAKQLGPTWIWRSSEPPRPAWAGPAMWDAYAGIRDLPAMRDYDSAPHAIAVAGRVYFGSTTDDTVRCLDAKTGALIWSFMTDGPVRLAPTWHDDRIYFGSDDGFVYCLAAPTGAEHWRYSPAPPQQWIINNGRLISPHPIRTGTLVENGRVLFGAGLLPWKSSYLCALDAKSGAVAPDGYRIELSNKTLEGPPASTGDQIVFPQGRVAPQLFQTADGKDLGALQKSSGGSIVVVAEDHLLHGPGADSRRGAIATSSAQSRQRIATFGQGNAMVVDKQVAYMVADGVLAAADLKTRKSLWRAPTEGSLCLIKAADVLIAGGVDQVVIHQASDGKVLWQHDVPGRVKGLAVSDGSLFVSTDEGVIVAFAADGELAVGATLPSDDGSPDADGGPQLSGSVAPLQPIEKVATPGLLGRWVFRRDQTRGRVVKDLAGAHSAQLDGAFRWQRTETQESIQWDGTTGSAIVAPDHNQAALPKQAMTVEAIVRVDEAKKWGGIVSVIQDNGSFERGWLLGFQQNKFSFALAGASSPPVGKGKLTYLAAPAPFEAEAWSHVVGVYTGQLMQLYVDGKLVAESKDQAGDIAYPPKTFFELGAYHDDNENYRLKGMLHEVRIYDRAFDSAEVGRRHQEAKPQIAALTPPKPLKLRRLPYLQFTDSDHARIEWDGLDSGKSWIEWWEDNGDSMARAAKTINVGARQAAQIGPLRPNRQYRYRVVADTDAGRQATEEFTCDTFFNYHPHRKPAMDERATGEEAAATARWFAEQTRFDGLCLVWGATLAKDAEQLAQHYRVLMIDDDPKLVESWRAKWIKEGKYGSCLKARTTDSLAEVTAAMPGDWANLVVANQYLPGLAAQLKPGGGRYFFLAAKSDGAKTDGEANNGKANKDTTLVESPDGRKWGAMERESWAGAGEWSHLYGAAHNAAFTGETLGGAARSEQLDVQWIGRPGPRYQADRSGRKPSPLATGGALFLQGWRRMIALDAHNGEPLWSLELPEFERFNVPRDCSNWCADQEAVYAAVADQTWQVDAASGTIRRRFDLPNQFRQSAAASDEAQPWAWGYTSRVGNRLLGTAVRRDAMWTDFWGNASAGWYDAKSGPVTAHVASDALFGYALNDEARDKASPVTWSYRGLILNATITARGSDIWFLECRDPEQVASDQRRLQGDALWNNLHLVCLDAADGAKRWEQKLEVAHGDVMVSLSHSDDRLVLVTSGDKKFHLYAFPDNGGESLWEQHRAWSRDNHGGHMSRPAIVDDAVYVRPFAFALKDGVELSQKLPVGGCGTYACTTEALFFRQSTVTMWDRESAKTTTWSRLRPDCWLSTIPAAGMLLSPEGGGGCSCGTWLETSIGFKPQRRRE